MISRVFYRINKCNLCGKEREISREQFFTHEGKQWKLEAKIWCRSSTFASKVGSFSNTQRKGAFGWVNKSVDEIRASFIGKVYNKTNGGCTPTVIPYLEDIEFGNHHVEANVPNSTTPKNPVYKPNECKSTHWCRIGQTKFIYLGNNGFLILD